jgi:hypothetical protein
MSDCTLEQFLRDNESLTASDRLRRAVSHYDYLMIKKMAVSSNSADGVSIQRNLTEFREYIKYLQQEAAGEAAPFILQRSTLEI